MVFEHDYDEFPELSNKQIEEYGFTSPHKQIVEDFRATVVKVIDGDTVRLGTDFRDFTFPLRILEINAPELSEGGEDTKEWLKSKIENAEVEIKINPNQRVGKYGRLLGKIHLNGLDIGQEMLFLGLVDEFGSSDADLIPKINKTFRLNQWF